jgi:hypothetical protein
MQGSDKQAAALPIVVMPPAGAGLGREEYAL